jgi:hypothetical protein
MSHAKKVVHLARESIRVLIELDRGSNIYRTQQACFNHFLFSALTVVFLACLHARREFSDIVANDFCTTLNLVKGFSKYSFISRKLWASIGCLEGVAPRLGLTLHEMNDPYSSASFVANMPYDHGMTCEDSNQLVTDLNFISEQSHRAEEDQQGELRHDNSPNESFEASACCLYDWVAFDEVVCTVHHQNVNSRLV